MTRTPTTADLIPTHVPGFETQNLTPDAYARAVWSIIGEPGDTFDAQAIAEHGAREALTLIVSGADVFTSPEAAISRDRLRARIAEGIINGSFQTAARIGAQLLTPDHPHWPHGLADLGTSAPHALWARGNTELLTQSPAIAIAGARAATGYGEHMAMEITAGLVYRGYTITSGAAYGIDGMAHRAALASGGRTVAYLAGGIDRYYPTGHDALLTRIAATGVVVSEMGCMVPPTKWRFLMRNRLIAASTQATVIIEAGHRSGSLNIAGHAADLGRPVGAVPGPVTSPASSGCHWLIRERGATMVTDTAEAAELTRTN